MTGMVVVLADNQAVCSVSVILLSDKRTAKGNSTFVTKSYAIPEKEVRKKVEKDIIKRKNKK
ncbi:MAG: hypothetical protein ACLVIY_04000 [Anaerobutyricum soehngenii]